MEIQYYLNLCACGCGGKIEIKPHHKYYGIPKYIKGHNNLNKILSEKQKQEISIRNKGKSWTEEQKKKQSNSHIGKKFNEEHRDKISKALKGKLKSEKHKQKTSKANRGKKRTEEQRKNISKSKKGKYIGENNPFYGKKHSEETRQKMKENHADFSLEKHWNWNNGLSFEPYSPEFNKQKKQIILKRDNYICQCPDCEHKTVNLDIHHIDYNKQNNNLENLITLCDFCHAKTFGKNKRLYWTEFYQNIMMNKLMECLL